MKKPVGKQRRRHLDDEDAALWDHAAQSVEPLKKAKSRVHPADELKDKPGERPRAKAAAAPVHPVHAKPVKPAQSEPVRAVKKPAPEVTGIERKKLKRLRKGHIEIDGRIDLHGLRQDEAHGALRAFLHRAQGRGWRWVIVITGKGIRQPRDADEAFDMSRARDRGVLKRNVPRWLEEPDLRPLIISYTTAAIEHGGEGALYVHLRKRG